MICRIRLPPFSLLSFKINGIWEKNEKGRGQKDIFGGFVLEFELSQYKTVKGIKSQDTFTCKFTSFALKFQKFLTCIFAISNDFFRWFTRNLWCKKESKKARECRSIRCSQAFLFGRSNVTWTRGLLTPSQARYQLRHTPSCFNIIAKCAALVKAVF